MSMRRKAALVIILIVFVITAVNYVSSRYFATRSLLETMGKDQSLIRDLAIDLVGARINHLKMDAAIVAKRLQETRSQDEMMAVMKTQLEEYPAFLAFAVFNRNDVEAVLGATTAPASFLGNSPYLAAAFEGKSVISTTRDEPLAQPPMVFHVCVPMGNDKVLGVTVPGMFFTDILADYRLWRTGCIYIIDEQGTLIAHFEQERILSRINYIEQAKTDPDLRSIADFFQVMLSQEEGVGTYSLRGVERICSYRLIPASTIGWRLAVMAPLNESPRANVQNGLFFAAVLFLLVGSSAAVFLSNIVVWPFSRIEEQNLHLEKLNETVRIQAAEIQAEHERSKILLDAMPLSAQLWDQSGHIFDCNAETVRLFQTKDKQEFIDRFLEFSPEYQPDGGRSVAMVDYYISKAIEDGRCVFEWMHRQLDGTPLPSEITVVRVNDDEGNVLAAYARDLREHKQMMGAIERRDSLLNTVNQMAVMLLQSEPDAFERDMHYCMGMMIEAVGIDRVTIWKNHTQDDELYLSKIYDWSRLHDWSCGGLLPPSDAPLMNISYEATLPGWEETLSRGECITGLVRDMPPAIQTVLAAHNVVSICVIPIFFRDLFWGFIGYDNCRSERLYSESEQSILRSGGMLIANAVLRNDMTKDLQTSAVQLEAAVEQAQEANHAKSSFLANMSHEMRTPLNAVLGLSELTLEGDSLNAEARVNLERIYNAGATLLGTVNDILDISKIEAGRFELLLHEYDIPSLINDTVMQNILRIGDKPIEFVLDVDEYLPSRLIGDELRIKQIFNNLLSNAFKYTTEGIVELGVHCIREEDSVWLIARVRDTGIGIKPEDLQRLFADYSQVNSKSNRNIEGTGLGLSIAMRLVKMMDGSISVESEFGKGSVFTVQLHQKIANDETIGREVVENLKNFRYSDNKREEQTRLVRLRMPYARVLVVDDNVTNLDVAKGLLKPYRMQVHCVTTGQQAVDAIRAESVRYNAIFMDHMMPEMDGIETAQLIRQIGTDYSQNIPIIAMTANAVVGNEEMFLSKGFQAFLPKPIEIYRLDDIVRHWVRNRVQEGLGVQQALPNDQTRSNKKDRRQQSERRMHGNRRIGNDRRTFELVIDGLDWNKGMERFDGDRQSFQEVLRSFAVNTRPLLEKIKTTTKDNLFDYAISVHGIKGSSRGIGAEIVGLKAESLELAAKAGDVDFVSRHNPEFLDLAFKLVDDIAKQLGIEDVEHPRPRKDKPDVGTLAKILTACREYNVDELDAAMTEIERFEYTSDDGLAMWLRQNVDQTNYAPIVEKLSSLIDEMEVSHG